MEKYRGGNNKMKKVLIRVFITLALTVVMFVGGTYVADAANTILHGKEDKIQQINAVLDSLDGKLTSKVKQVNDLNTQVSDLQTQIQTLKANYNTAQANYTM